MKTRSRLALGGMGVVAAMAAMACSAGAQTTTAQVGAFPMPGVASASPETQISLRGAPAAQLGSVTVTGSKTGAHAGTLQPHSDGNGASFVLDKPLDGGETVNVKTDLNIPKAKDGDWSFKTATRPKKGLGSGSAPPNLELLQELTGQVGTPPKGSVPQFRSRPDLRPPEIQVFKTTASTPGFVFVAPKKVFGAKPRAGLQSGPLILDNKGQPVWFAQNDKGNVTDFRVQQLDGQPVLTWWQGRAVLGTGEGVVQVVDSTYKPVRTIRGGNGYQLDFHETTITPQGTFLGIVYNPVRRDLRAWGGPKDARVIDSVIQELDIKTGLVMWEWHSLGTIALDESYAPVPGGGDPLWDYVHANSVVLTPDNEILVSGRELWAGVVLDRTTGALKSRIGGKKSTYRMLGTSRFAYQHDITIPAKGVVQIFDNEAAPRVRSQSRALVLKLDEAKKTATVQRADTHKPNPLLAGTQGNVQSVGTDGTLFVGWGSQGYFSQFAPNGSMTFDARIARGQDTYRAYRFPWVGVPSSPPSIAQTSGGKSVYASWNGATQVARWEVLAGASAASLAPVGSAARSSFETRISSAGGAFVAVRALDSAGNVLGTSKAISTSS
ncbi:MAG: hypothetical protein QOG77_2990 [Solirubrobacteraceae bacterium]|nr:hypothetical protein [Solirubrobacteraceae bacterium]